MVFVRWSPIGCCCDVDGPWRCHGVGGALGTASHRWPWCLTIGGCLPWVHPPPGKTSWGFCACEGALAQGMTRRPKIPTPLRSMRRSVLLCHAICVTLSMERLVVPRSRWSGWHHWTLKLARASKADAQGIKSLPSTSSSRDWAGD
jgi:hypothetical protein